MPDREYNSKLDELLGARIEAIGKYQKAKEKFKIQDEKAKETYDKEAHQQRKKALEQLKKDGQAKEGEEKDYLASIEKHLKNKKNLSEEEVSFFENAKRDLLITQKEYNKQLAELSKEEEDFATKAFQEKWKGIETKTKDYTNQVNGALQSMFGATTKYLEKEKELMGKELAEIEKELEKAKKVTAAAAQDFANVKKKAQEEIDKKFALKHTDTDEQKDQKEADREAAYADIEELQTLYDKKQELADKNAEHEGEIGYQAEQLSVEEADRLDELSLTHQSYITSLDEKTKAKKIAQEKETDLEEQVAAKKADIEKKEKQKQRVEMSQQMIAASVNIAQGITKALAMGPIVGPIMASIVGAAGAVQIGMMSAQMAKMKLEDGGLLSGKRHSQGGMRIQGSNIEVEGGEYVVNRQSTDKNLGLISYINSQRRQFAPSDLDAFFAKSAQGFESPFRQAFAQGGQLPNMEPTTNIDNELLVQAIQSIKFEPKVSVTDINTVQSDIVKVDAWTGM